MLKEEELTALFNHYAAEIAKIRLIGLNNYHLYLDFPKNITAELKEIWKKGFETILSKFNADDKESTVITSIPANIGAFIQPFLVFHRRGGLELESLHFLQLALQQEFIMYLAYLEAFFQDYRKHLYKIDPKLLSNKDRTITWEEITEKKSLEEIHELLVEKCLEKSGYDKINEVIEKLNNKPIQLKIKLEKEQINYLNEMVLIRNMIVHNNSKVSNDYKKLRKDSPFKVGDEYLLNFEQLYVTYNFLQWVIFESFVAFKIKYFGGEYSNICDQFGYVKNYKPDLSAS